MILPTVKQITLTNFIRTASRTGTQIDKAVSVINEDLQNIYKYLAHYGIALQNTFSSDSISPFEEGLDGANIVIDKLEIPGRFYNDAESRPKSIKEIVEDIYMAIDTSLAEDLPATVIADIKEKIGNNIFNSTVLSSEGSIDNRISELLLTVDQLRADIFNVGRSITDAPNNSDYSITGNGSQSQSLSILDKIAAINAGKQEVVLLSAYGNSQLNGGFTRRAAPGFDAISQEGEDDHPYRFVSPYSKTMKVEKIIIVSSPRNYLIPCVITLYKNDIETNLSVAMLDTSLDETTIAIPSPDILVEEGDKLHYMIQVGEPGNYIGYVVLDSITLTLKEV